MTEPSYTPTTWHNTPSTTTPLDEDNLNKLEQGVQAATARAAKSLRYDAAQGLTSGAQNVARVNLGLGDAATRSASDFVAATQVGAAGGIATLDGSTKVPSAQVPDLAASFLSNFRPVYRPLEGVPLLVYGHSFTPIPGAYCTKNGGEWPSRLASRFGMQVTSRGVSGAKMSDIAKGAIGSQFPGVGTVNTVGTGLTGIIVLEGEVNDILFESVVADATKQLGWKHSLRAFIAAATAATRIEANDPSVTTSGTWSELTQVQGGFSGGSCSYTDVIGAYKEWANVSSPAGYVWILSTANDTTSTTGTLDVSVDGVAQGINYTGQGQMKAHTSGTGGGTYTFSPAAIKVTVPTTGTHTIRVTKTAGGTLHTYVDALLIPSVNPPQIFVCKDPPNDSTATSGIGGTLQAAYTTYAATYHALLDSVVAEFPGIAHSVDLGTGWVPATMKSSLDTTYRFHPGDRGMAQLTDTLQSALFSVVTDYVQGVNVN